jgi:predicted O-linked N-acetylglucosamine transferase (SPINDLY family)
MGYLLKDIITRHDPKKIKAIAYALNPKDDTPLYQHFQKKMLLRNLSNLSNLKAIAQIRRDRVDILVDLMGHTQGSRLQLFSTHPAPIQISWLGFPGTTGAPFINYILADPILIPPSKEINLDGIDWGTPISERKRGSSKMRASTLDGGKSMINPNHRFYTEDVIYLPHAIPCLDVAKSQGKPTRSQIGLPENRFLFVAPGDPAKITPEHFEIWCRLINQVKDSRLWLFTPHPLVVKNLRHHAGQNDLDPNRLIFSQPIPFKDHLKRLTLADLALDTFPYSGGATTAMCLAAGVPVITQTGKSYVSRLTASLLHAYGLDSLITQTPKQYERLALSLAQNPTRIQNSKLKIQNYQPTDLAGRLTQTYLDIFHSNG